MTICPLVFKVQIDARLTHVTDELTAIIVLDDVLSIRERKDFLDHAVAEASSRSTPNEGLGFGEYQSMIVERILHAWERAKEWLPFHEHVVSSIELELAIYQHGAPLHADDELEEDRSRFMNFVCFLHEPPRRLTAGRIRIWEIHENEQGTVLTGRTNTVHSLQNQIVFLQSRLPYEVSPTKYFTDDIAHRLFVVRGWLRHEACQ